MIYYNCFSKKEIEEEGLIQGLDCFLFCWFLLDKF